MLYLDLIFIRIGSISYLFLISIVQLCSIVFRFRWQQQYRRKYPDEFLDKADARYIFLSFCLATSSIEFWFMHCFNLTFSLNSFNSCDILKHQVLESALLVYFFILSNIIIHNNVILVIIFQLISFLKVLDNTFVGYSTRGTS